jgi:hypothetical protein
MWVFTRFGFFSVVCDTKHGPLNPEMLMIRARVRSHLEKLKNKFSNLKVFPIEDYKPGNDYECRIYVPKQVWENVMAQLVSEIDYGNFKNEAIKEVGYGKYSSSLSKVWYIMANLGEN